MLALVLALVAASVTHAEYTFTTSVTDKAMVKCHTGKVLSL